MKYFLCLALAFAGIPGQHAFADIIDLKLLVTELHSPRSDVRAKGAAAIGKLGPVAAGAVPDLVAALTDKSVPVQLEVMLAIEHIGPAARAAVPDLVKILRAENAKLYSGAADALGAIGRDSLEAAPALFDLLKEDDAAVATSAGMALTRILPDDVGDLQQVVPVLVAALSDKRSQVRSAAIVALGMSGRVAVPGLTGLVKDFSSEPDLAWQAAAALELIGPPAQPAVAALVDSLQSPVDKVVIHAARALGAIGPESRQALPQLRKMLARESTAIRMHAARAIGDLGTAAQPAVGDLVTALKDRDAGLRREAARALGKIGPGARLAVPSLLAAMNDVDGTVTMQAAMALGRIGPDAVPGLVSALRDENLRHLAAMILGDIGPAAKPAVEALASIEVDPDVDRPFRREVLLALARIGPEAKGAVPVLMQILGDKEHTLRPGAAWALAKIGAPEAAPLLIKAIAEEKNTRLAVVAPIALAILSPDNAGYVDLALPKLIELLGHDSGTIRFEVASAIKAIGPRAKAAVPKLAAAVAKEPDPALRNAYLSALAAIGPAAAPALPALLAALADPEPPLRYSATYAVGRIGEGAKAAIPVLEKNLQERDEILQIASAWALVQIDPKRDGLAAECVAPLVRALKLPDPHYRNEAAVTLGQIGPSARSAVAPLEALSSDPDEAVQKAAAEALEKIGK